MPPAIKVSLPLLIPIPFAPVREGEYFQPPVRANESDSGWDLRVSRDVVIAPGTRSLVPSNTKFQWPVGVYAMLFPRSSTLYKKGLVVVPTIIDSGYRGEVMVVAFNPRSEPVQVQKGDRLVQVVPMVTGIQDYITFIPVEDFPRDTDRGERGIGSSGE